MLDDDAADDELAALDDGRDPLTGQDGRLRLSFTRIDTLRNCALRFRYQYVDRLPQRPAPALSFGSSIHAVLEWVHDRKVPDVPPLDEMLDRLREVWDSSGYAEVEKAVQVREYERARDVLAAYHARVSREGMRTPVGTEAWFELPFDDDVTVVGSIDRVDAAPDGTLHIVDYKTNKQAKSRKWVASSLQLGIYALATEHLYGAVPRTVALDFVVPGVVVRVDRDELDLAAVPRLVAEAAAAVRAGAADPNPTKLCDWCDFRSVCPAWDGDGDEVLGRAVMEARALRARLRREVRELRALEDTVRRLGGAS
ncbi:MAG: RecB family exonuclease [Nitriliruptoraceae bacterium]